MTNVAATAPSDPLGSSRLDKLLEFLSPYSILGAIFGIGAGIWGVHVHKVLANESSVLLGTAAGDIALLAVILAAVALMSSFLQKNYGRVIEDAAGLDVFFLPFKIIACVSAAAALTSFAGAMDAESGAEWFRVALFGLAVALTVWTILGTVMLIFTFIQYSTEEREFASKELR